LANRASLSGDERVVHDRRETDMSPSSWVRIMLLAFGLAVSAGCGWPWPCPCPGGGTETVSVVLTFDDGPLPADVSTEVRADGGEELLDPLKIILEVLQRRGVQAVFFVAGPGPSGETDVLQATWARGIAAMRAAGHVLGYHAFDHDAEVWAAPLRPPAIALSMISADLDELERTIDQALGPLDLAGTDVFSPLFRQPFGGALFSSHEGWRTAHERGWTYHAYAIDSADWIVNADVGSALRDQVVFCAGGDVSQVVIDQLAAGLAKIGRAHV
jgi:peptidoglycan/xylan/chitin deacetylase (PgdA/CDA1 family)